VSWEVLPGKRGGDTQQQAVTLSGMYPSLRIPNVTYVLAVPCACLTILQLGMCCVLGRSPACIPQVARVAAVRDPYHCIVCWCCVCFHCAGKEQFDAALHQFWEERSAASGERVPTPIFVGSSLVEPWHFWREVWAWGGPEEVSKMKVGGGLGGQGEGCHPSLHCHADLDGCSLIWAVEPGALSAIRLGLLID
jgi:hypothetical protein